MFSVDFANENKKTIQIVSCDRDHRQLQIESLGAGATQGEVIHLLLELMRFRTRQETSKAAPIEAFALLIARDMGIIDEAEYFKRLAVADYYPGHEVLERIQDLFKQSQPDQ